ncbi:serine-rich adhesin for platelets-like isoform X2 [Haliotis rubra]|uniref:serine-rich adhesin for platelets-like isoform X2 n=1 Tax=Haliotis rubra TaxID=36100 RepID=UPI001EE4FEB2|nr:serine-rich adhesin for platelets-like isoform X2 [Haliotis rubra]
MPSVQRQFNMQKRPAMNRSHLREAPGTVHGNPPPAGMESENHGQSGAHGNISVPNIFPIEQTLTPPSANTSSHPGDFANYAQPQGSVDVCPRIDPVLPESRRERFETPSHGNTIHHPHKLSSNIHQESLQTDEQDVSLDLSQIHVSEVNRGGQVGHGSGNSSSEANVQPSRSPFGARTGGSTGPDRGNTDNCISDDALYGDGRSSDSQNVPKQDHSLSDKPSTVIKLSKSFSGKLSEQPTSASTSSSTILRNNLPQYQSPLNTTDNNPSETFQPLPENDLIIEPDLDEDGIQTNATKSKDKLSESSSSQGESSRLTKYEDEECTVLKSLDSSQGTNSSTDTTAIKYSDKKENGSVTSDRLADVSDQGSCHNAGEGNDNKSGVGSFAITEPSPLTADQNPGMSPATDAATVGPCDDITSGERLSNGADKVPSCQGPNGMDVFDHGSSNDRPKNHRGTVASGQGPRKNIGTLASGPGAEKNLATVASGQGDGSHLRTVASDQGQRDTRGKDDNGPSDGSRSLTSGQEPSDDIDTVGPHQGPSNGSPSPPIAPRTPGDGQSLTDQKVTKSLATQTSNSDESNTVSVKTHMTSGSAKHGVLDNVTKPLETDSALSDKLKTPLAKQNNEEVNKVLTHELKTDGPAYISATKCAAPNVLKTSTEVPPTSPVPAIHYHYHAGNQGPGMFDPNVFTPLGQYPQFTPLHVNGPPPYPGHPAAPPAQNPQQRGPVNMSQQAPINIVNCANVQIGTDGKMIIGDQRERMTERDNEDPYDSLTSAAPNREDSPPPYSQHNPSFPTSTFRKTPLTHVSMIPSQTESRGGNPACGGQEAVITDVSQPGSESLENASGLTRDGPRSCFPSERMTSEGRQVQTGFTDLQPHLGSASGLSDITSFTVTELGSASDFLEMVQSELSEDRDSSLSGKGETSLPSACSKQNTDDSQLTTEDSCTPSTLNRSNDTFFCANTRRNQVYLNMAKTLLQQYDFQSEGKSSSVDSELD